MKLFNDESLLELAELYASDYGHICSEDEASERFDEMLAECSPEFDTEDKIAVNEAFSCWMDGLCKDGEIHPEQYNSYEYIGEHA